MRAKDIDWKIIARRLACHRTTAWRAWQKALTEVAIKLNEGAPIGRVSHAGQKMRGIA
jgi:predicted DNA-binding protein (UPF0251 family)